MPDLFGPTNGDEASDGFGFRVRTIHRRRRRTPKKDQCSKNPGVGRPMKWSVNLTSRGSPVSASWCGSGETTCIRAVAQNPFILGV